MDTQQLSSLPSQPKAFLSLPGIGDLLNKGWQIYKERIGVFLGIMIVPTIVNFGVSLILAGLFAPTLGGERVFPLSLAWIPVVVLLLILMAMIVSIWSSVALLYAIKEREAKIGIKESFIKGRSKIISYFWISLLAGLVIFAGFLLLIIPGIIFLIWFGFAGYVLIAENLTGTKALSRSKQLVSGFWWDVFWRFFTLFIIAVVISFILNLIFGPIELPLSVDLKPIITSLFFTPFAATYAFLIYEDLRKLKEGASI